MSIMKLFLYSLFTLLVCSSAYADPRPGYRTFQEDGKRFVRRPDLPIGYELTPKEKKPLLRPGTIWFTSIQLSPSSNAYHYNYFRVNEDQSLSQYELTRNDKGEASYHFSSHTFSFRELRMGANSIPYFSVGSDESVVFFALEKAMSQEEFDRLQTSLNLESSRCNQDYRVQGAQPFAPAQPGEALLPLQQALPPEIIHIRRKTGETSQVELSYTPQTSQENPLSQHAPIIALPEWVDESSPWAGAVGYFYLPIPQNAMMANPMASPTNYFDPYFISSTDECLMLAQAQVPHLGIQKSLQVFEYLPHVNDRIPSKESKPAPIQWSKTSNQSQDSQEAK